MSNLTQLSLFDPVVIKLTKGYETIVDPVDADLAQLKWAAIGTEGNNYAKRTVKGKPIALHRVILSRMIKRELTKEEKVDHINGNRFDNRRCNLRLATQQQNCRNARIMKNNRSGLKGAGYHNGKWQAQIVIDGKKTYLGIFNTPEEAHEAYCQAAKQHFGEFARFE